MKLRDYWPNPLPSPLTGTLAHTEPGQRVYVVANPASTGTFRVVDQISQTAINLGLPIPKVLYTTKDSPGQQQAKQALDEGADSVIAVGGDGTLRKVAGELCDSHVPLSVIPAGSGNVFARNIGMKVRDLAANTLLALTGKTTFVDLCWADMNVSSMREPMLVMAGMGREAEAVSLATPDLKGRYGWGAYVPAVVRKAFAPAMPLQVSIDGAAEQDVLAWTVVASNCPCLPMHIVAFPQAKLDDGLVEILQLRISNPLQWVPVAFNRIANVDAQVSSLGYSRGREITVSASHPALVQVDGDDIAGVRELRVTVAPAALLVRVPEGVQQT